MLGNPNEGLYSDAKRRQRVVYDICSPVHDGENQFFLLLLRKSQKPLQLSETCFGALIHNRDETPQRALAVYIEVEISFRFPDDITTVSKVTIDQVFYPYLRFANREFPNHIT